MDGPIKTQSLSRRMKCQDAFLASPFFELSVESGVMAFVEEQDK